MLLMCLLGRAISSPLLTFWLMVVGHHASILTIFPSNDSSFLKRNKNNAID